VTACLCTKCGCILNLSRANYQAIAKGQTT